MPSLMLPHTPAAHCRIVLSLSAGSIEDPAQPVSPSDTQFLIRAALSWKRGFQAVSLACMLCFEMFHFKFYYLNICILSSLPFCSVPPVAPFLCSSGHLHTWVSISFYTSISPLKVLQI